MKQKVYLNEESLQRLVENCVYDMLNEDMDEGLWGGMSNLFKKGGQAVGNKAKQLGQKVANGAKQFGQNVANAYQDGSYNQDYQNAVAKCRKYQQAINQLKQQYRISNSVINSDGEYNMPKRGSKSWSSVKQQPQAQPQNNASFNDDGQGEMNFA